MPSMRSILMTTFTMLNLLIAVIVNATQAEHDLDSSQLIESAHAQTRAEVRALATELTDIKSVLNSRHP